MPSLGHSLPFTQAGDGTTPGYDAIDVRRMALAGWQEGPLSQASYLVSQRGAGANMSVDVASSTGPGLVIQGDSVTQQGRYFAPPHSAVINLTVGANGSGSPRIDSIVVYARDNTHDASGLNEAQVEILAGTPTGGATKETGTGAATLPNGAMLLAYVEVANGAASITNANIKDMRPKRRGKVNIATSEATTATSYAYNNLATPDRVTQIVLPTDGLIAVWFQALWQNTVASNGRAAIFIGANQIKRAAAPPQVMEATGNSNVNIDVALGTTYGGTTGLSSGVNSNNETEVTTGEVIGSNDRNGGPVYIFAAAGTYDVSVQFKNNAAGTTTVKNRHLWVASLDFDNATLP